MSSEEESIELVLQELAKNLHEQLVVTEIVQTAMAEAYRTGSSQMLTDRQRAERLGKATGTAVTAILDLLRDRKTD